MATANTSISGALENLAQILGALSEVPSQANTDPREELIVRYTIGQGVVYAKSGGRNKPPTEARIRVEGKMYKLDGTEDGSSIGIDAPVSLAALQEAKDLSKPPNPKPPFNEPKSPVAEVNILSYTKGFWRFADGSSITAVGPANVRVVLFSDEATELWITGDQIITGGTGRYAEAQGLKTVAGSFWVRPGRELFIPEPFSAKTIEVFRIVRSEYIGH
jgi:hypothetical protein